MTDPVAVSYVLGLAAGAFLGFVLGVLWSERQADRLHRCRTDGCDLGTLPPVDHRASTDRPIRCPSCGRRWRHRCPIA